MIDQSINEECLRPFVYQCNDDSHTNGDGLKKYKSENKESHQNNKESFYEC